MNSRDDNKKQLMNSDTVNDASTIPFPTSLLLTMKEIEEAKQSTIYISLERELENKQ